MVDNSDGVNRTEIWAGGIVEELDFLAVLFIFLGVSANANAVDLGW